VEHKKRNQMLCHYCGYMHEKIIRCNKCDSDEKLVTLGPGIEKIEEEINHLFPNANVITLTSDTVSDFKKASQIIKDIESKKYDIILGTQMLAKGLNFPDLHLVGVIDADISFAGCDLRILERTFQLLYQVAGRAGRQHDKGLVLIQTYFADNPLLHYIENWDYESFINDELKNRKDTFMPPFSRLIMIKGSCLSEHVLHSFMHHIAQKAPIDKQVEVLGPSPAPMYKIRNKFRYRIILRTSKQVNIQDYIHNWFNQFVIPTSIKLKVDIDPYNFS
jgi:primosomal protein N' (replication factor Y)